MPNLPSSAQGQSQSTKPAPRSLLVRSVNWLGDAVMTTPAMQRLREHLPQTQITLLANEKLADLWDPHPAVHSVITFNRADTPWSVARRLRSHRFDAALVLPNSPRSALETWLAGIPDRIGYSGIWRNVFLSRPLNYPPERVRPRPRGIREVKRLILEGHAQQTPASRGSHVHQIHDYLHLAAALGCDPSPLPPKLEVNPHEVEEAMAGVRQALTMQHSLRREHPPVWLGLNASAAYGPAKRWPVERFAEVTGAISRRLPNCVWLSFGGAAEWDLGEQVASLGKGRLINLAGKTSLRQLMALLSSCRVLLTNDSGPMHVAAALGTPVVVPFGSTSPALTAPGQPGDPRHHLLQANAACSPCFRRTCPIDFRCMTGISVERVINAIRESLKIDQNIG